MVIVMEEAATDEQISAVIEKLVKLGFDIHRSTGVQYTVLGAVGGRIVDTRDIELLDGVKEVPRITSTSKLASRRFKPQPTPTAVKNAVIRGARVLITSVAFPDGSRRQAIG